jgi:peroxiredoxin
MKMDDRKAPLATGEPAPDFTLPAAHADGTISFAEYRSQGPVLLAMFRGLY